MDSSAIKTRIIGFTYLCMLPVLGLLITLAPVNSNAVVDLPFLQDSSYKRVLAFGGFPSCSTGCPISINTLRQTYIDYQKLTDKQDIGIVFVNIRRDMPQQISTQYIKSFHPDFVAYSAQNNDSKKLYTSLALKTFSSTEEISQHQGFIYLFKTSNNQWQLEKVFNNDVDTKTLLSHLVNHPV